jgi:ribonucleoside-diphosphate reductase alpha chain
MKITRKFTKAGQDPFSTVEWTKRSSRISNPDGTVVFEMTDAEVPVSWSQLATDIMVSKYFRKAGVPQDGGPNGIASHDWDSGTSRDREGAGESSGGKAPLADACGSSGGKQEPLADARGSSGGKAPLADTRGSLGQAPLGPEKSARQVIHRLAGCWRYWGESHGYFDTAEDAQAFEDELKYMMVHQMCAPNSPQWFNTGLHWAYGINGPAQGHWIADPATGEVKLAEDAYSHPQPHACFIQSISDDLVNEGGIMDLWTREARLFKYGSGTGTNFSNLRAENEKLSGGGKSSGLMSWLKIGDRAAGAIKSGGTTRRAAKMVCLDMDHPDIRSFVNWKVREEIKVAALVEGMKAIAGKPASVHDKETLGQTAERLGLKLEYDFNGEAYQTVSGQNSNNSVRIPDAFFDALDADREWQTIYRTTGKVASTMQASELWNDIGYAAWRCADPGVQFDTTINAWHTCPNAGRINASNPCSEYMFIDDTACNLASLNVLKFFDRESLHFDTELYEHGVDLWTMVLEISVLMAAFPSREIAERSYRYRTLGLGYANLGAMLMQAGIPYDSDSGRSVCAMLTSIMTGRSYRMSALLAGEHGAFAGFEADKENMLRVIRNHRRAAHGVSRNASEWEALRIRPVPIDHDIVKAGLVPLANAAELLDRATIAWDEALSMGTKHGYRNAQTTVIAPTGTIGLLMDCDTTGVEPDFALVKFKKLAGGGYFKIANASVKPALMSLGYSDSEITQMLRYLLGALSLDVPMPSGVSGADSTTSLSEWLTKQGVPAKDLAAIEASLPGVFELGFAFTGWALSDEGHKALGFDPDQARADYSFNLLKKLGLTQAQIAELNRVICGTQTVEGAPHLKDEHLAVFDCANACGELGKRFIEAGGHIRMMGAAQSFISGAISKTINLPNDAKVEDITTCYRQSWELGLKANALYRDGCKLSQPLSTSSGSNEQSETDDEAATASGEIEAKAEVADSVAKVANAVAGGDHAQTVREVTRIVHRPMRRRLPDTRHSLTHKFNVAGHEGYLTVGLYEDGMPGELFITMAKEGSTIGGLMDSLGTATSVALQYGVPVESMVTKFTHQRFEPAGMTANSEIPFAKSLVDYIFRWMGIQFVPGYREANVPVRTGTIAPAARADVSFKSDVSLKADATSKEDRRWTDTPDTTTTDADGGIRPSPRSGQVSTAASISMVEITTTTARASTLSAALESVADSPPCDVCGTITVRSGTCYKCLNCGNSMGCS